jgi:hypothetical protein
MSPRKVRSPLLLLLGAGLLLVGVLAGQFMVTRGRDTIIVPPGSSRPSSLGVAPATAFHAATSSGPRAGQKGDPAAGARLLDSVSARHAAQRTDADWGRVATPLLSAKLRGIAGTKVRSVDCREDICRVELVYASLDASTEFYHFLSDATNRPWNGEMLLGNPNDGGGAQAYGPMLLFIAREATTLRMPD